MKPQKQPSKPSHQDLFRIELDRLINEAHPLVKLSAQMDWQSLDEHFGACFCEEARPAINTRLMVSLHYLKYVNNLSDEETLAVWVENPYLRITCVDLSHSAHPCLWLITWDPTETRATRPLAIQKDGTWYCYGHDLTKNVCEVFGSAGNIRTVYSYTPYGEVTAEGNVSQPIQWSSEFYDAELALVYYNYRHYNPAEGRWINRDPIAEQGGWNLYRMINNEPIRNVDILGLASSLCGAGGYLTALGFITRVSAASLQRRLGIASIEALKELFKAKGGKKGYWFCVATGTTLPAKKGKKDCPSKIQGSAVGQNEESAAKLSKKNAKDQVPRDCCPKHLQPYCTKM